MIDSQKNRNIYNIPKSNSVNFPLMDIKNVINQLPPPLDFVLPSLGLLKQTVGCIAAPGGFGKSWLGLQIAAHVACGFDSLDIGDVKRGRVLIMSAEDPEDVLWHRIRTLSDRMSNSQREDFTNNLLIAPCVGLHFNLLDGGATSNAIIKFGELRLIVLDTLSRAHDGEENDRGDASRVMRVLELIAKETGAAVIFLHHVGKVSPPNIKTTGRGSSVWFDDARWFGCLNEVNQDTNHLKLCIGKVNYGAPVAEKLLRRGDSGELLVDKPSNRRVGKPSDKTDIPKVKTSVKQW